MVYLRSDVLTIFFLFCYVAVKFLQTDYICQKTDVLTAGIQRSRTKRRKRFVFFSIGIFFRFDSYLMTHGRMDGGEKSILMHNW